jgi:hypothetical protein
VNKDEALDLALEAINATHPWEKEEAIKAIKQALAEPEEKWIYGTPLLDAFTKPAPKSEKKHD